MADTIKLDDLLKNRDLHSSLEYLLMLKIDNGSENEAIKSLYEKCSNEGDRQFVSLLERRFRLIDHYSSLKALFKPGYQEEVYRYSIRHKKSDQSVHEFIEEAQKAYELFFGPITEKLKSSSAPALIYSGIIEGILKKIQSIAASIKSKEAITTEILDDFKAYLKSVLYLTKDQYKAMRFTFDLLEEEKSLDKDFLTRLEEVFFLQLRQEYAQKLYQFYQDKKYERIEALLDEAAVQKLNIKDIFLKSLINAVSLHEKNLFNALHFFEYITDLGFEAHGLHPHEILKISLFAERKLRGEGNEQPKFYAKGQKGRGLPCPLIIDRANHLFYVLLENKESSNADRSSEKQFTPTIVIDKTKKEAKLIGLTHKFRYKGSLEENIERLTRYSGKRGLAGLLFQTTFKKPSESVEKTLAHELFMHDLIPFTHFAKHFPGDAKKSLPLKDLIDVIEDISCGIETMHAMDDVHADIKLENVLYGEKEKKPYAALTDFGLTYNVKKEQPLWIGFWYGTIFYTPPEFLEFPNAKHDAKAADMFALGCILHELIIGPLPWYEDIVQLDESSDKSLLDILRKEPSQENKKKYIQTFNSNLKQQVIDRQIQFFKSMSDEDKQKKDLKPKEALLLVIKKLLNPNPTKRLTASQFRQSIAELKANMA